MFDVCSVLCAIYYVYIHTYHLSESEVLHCYMSETERVGREGEVCVVREWGEVCGGVCGKVCGKVWDKGVSCGGEVVRCEVREACGEVW